MFEAVAVLLSVITLVLQRRDRMEDRGASREISENDVLDLYDKAQEWARLAEDLRRAVHAWQLAGYPTDDSFGIFEARTQKQAAVADFDHYSGQLRTFLQVHSPEVSDSLEHLASRSSGNLEELTERLLRARDLGPQAVDEVIRQFDVRTAEVLDAIGQLRLFIKAEFPARRLRN